MVENAVRHGIAPRSAPGTVEIDCTRKGDVLRLEVRDDGPGLRDRSPGARTGVGVAATRQRLTEMYGDSHRFELSLRQTGGTRVVIEIPLRTQPSPHPGSAHHER
jgi:two-component system, LytTR family, sensor kinase